MGRRDAGRDAARELERSGWSNGCPIATVALETAGQPETLSDACHTAFVGWRGALTESLIAAGITDGPGDLALTILAGMEGAMLLARAARDGQLLRAVGDQLADLIETKLVETQED